VLQGESKMPLNHPEALMPLVEVLGYADQGLSRPMRCYGHDGQMYYVKGQQTNRSSLWAEWLCAHAAKAFGLNIPPFKLVQLDELLWHELPIQYRSLGCLPAFGSQQYQQVNWLELNTVNLVPAQLRRDVLVFDWWVRNTDRTKGNTNLLWDANNQKLVVIDHNLAFDPDFQADVFLNNHIFSVEWAALAEDLVLQAEYSERLEAAFLAVKVARDSAPSEWMWENSELDVPTPFDVDAALVMLARCTTPELWRSV
jgi:hypothetical protein